MKIYQKLIALILVFAFGIFAFSCKTAPTQNANTAIVDTANANTATVNTANANTAPPADRIINVQPSYAQSPTESYKGIYEAVKAKDTELIKSFMTQQTLAFAQGQAEMQKKPVEDMYKNGFLATTFADKLPEIRDERIKDNMGAVEVYNEKDKKWEDTFFILENGGWKLAIGDVFSGAYKSPGKGKAQLEMDASNKTPGAMPMPATNSNNMPPPVSK